MVGSDIAKSGFDQEELFVSSFNEDTSFQFNVCRASSLPLDSYASKVSGKKHDVVLASDSRWAVVHAQLKKFKGGGFNQVDKRWVYEWRHVLPDSHIEQLMLFTGATFYPERTRLRPFELSDEFKSSIASYQKSIVCDSLCQYSNVDWYYCFNEKKQMIAFKYQDLIDLVLSEPVEIFEKRTTIKLGKYMTWQKKGGDRGEKTATMIQTKLKTGKVCHELLSLGKAKLLEFTFVQSNVCG